MTNEDPITEILEHRLYGEKRKKSRKEQDEDDLYSCVKGVY